MSFVEAAAVAAIALAPTSAHSDHPKHHPGHIRGCNTYRCDRRMHRKAHQRTVQRWKRRAAPYAGWLYSTRMCESGGNYRTNTGNGFFGAYQFDYSSWLATHPTTQYAHQAEPAEQDYRATVWLRMAGRGAWPVCG